MCRKIITLFMIATMALSMVACGDSGKNEAVNQTESTTDVTTEPSEENAENTASEPEVVVSPNSISLAYNPENASSAVITYNPENVEIIDLAYNAVKFELIENPEVVLHLYCEYQGASVQDIYDNLMGQYFEDENFTISELQETKLDDWTVWYSEAIWESAEASYEMFALELDNGMILYCKRFQGFDEKVSLKDLLPLVLTEMKMGDGTVIRPAMPYEIRVAEDAMNIDFASGENFVFDFDESAIEVNQKIINGKAYFLGIEDSWGIDLDVTNNYANASEYFGTMREYDSGKVSEFSGNGQNFVSMSIGRFSEAEECYYIDFGNGYALCGRYSAENNGGRALEEMLTALVGTLETAKPAVANGNNSFGYTAPTQLGNDTASMIYQMNGVLYRFPTPASEFLAHGWAFIEEFEIQGGKTVETAIQFDDFAYVVDVQVQNVTSEPVSVSEGLVTWMQVSDFTLEVIIPGMYVDTPTSIFDLHYTTNAYDMLVQKAPSDPVFQDGFNVFSWFTEDGRGEVAVACTGVGWSSHIDIVAFEYH